VYFDAEFMSLSKINKEYKKLYRLYRRSSSFLDSNVILLSDSKGLALNEILSDDQKRKIRVIAKKGATITDIELARRVVRAVKNSSDPIVVVWFGTCEITAKEGKYITIKSHPYQNIEFTLTKYREFRDKLLRENHNTKIVFLECPYYSISRYNSRSKKCKDMNNNPTPLNKGKKHYPNLVVNKVRGRRQVALASQVDIKLCHMVDYFNDQLKLVNTFKTPRISQDIIASGKRIGKEYTKYRKNWNTYTDGIHPMRTLTKLLLYRIIALVTKIQSESQVY